MNRRRKGFSLIEIVTVLVVIGIIALLARMTMGSVRQSADELATRPAIGAVQVEGRRLVAEAAATTNNPAFPADLVGLLSPNGLTVTSGASAGPDEVSVYRVDDVTALYASFGGGKCLVVVDRLVGTTGWGALSDAEVCTASMFSDRTSELTGTSDAPATL